MSLPYGYPRLEVDGSGKYGRRAAPALLRRQ